jgi:hypothetical protein
MRTERTRSSRSARSRKGEPDQSRYARARLRLRQSSTEFSIGEGKLSRDSIAERANLIARWVGAANPEEDWPVSYLP